MNRRNFIQAVAGSTGLWALDPLAAAPRPAAKATDKTAEDEKIRRLIDAHRPSRIKKLPLDFNTRVGASHVAGLYHLTDKPFLIEGAEKLLELGSRLGKFWFMSNSLGDQVRGHFGKFSPPVCPGHFVFADHLLDR